MANPAVEKLKNFGLRHGEKVAVGVTATLFVLFVALAIRKPTIEVTADQIKTDSAAADSNLNKNHSREDILATLEGQGLVAPQFEAKIDQQAGQALVASNFALPNPFAVPEPGAGLIRDRPVLIAPFDLYARAGRGGTLVYKLDEQGNPIAKVQTEEEKKKPASRLPKSRRRRQPAMAGGYGGGGGYGSAEGAMPGMPGGKPLSAEEKKKERERQAKALQRGLVGTGNVKDEPQSEEDALATAQEFEEELMGVRYVTLTGAFNHQQQRENYAKALKLDQANAHPNYQRLDVERQQRLDDGAWSDWSSIDRAANERIVKNVPEIDEEWTPEDVRLAALVDRLPFLRAGTWMGVHYAPLVPKEKRELPKEEPKMAMGGYGGYGSMSEGYGPGMAMGGRMGMMGGSAMSSGSMYGSSGAGVYGGEMMGGYAGPAEDTNFPTSMAETLMVRSLDFTVEPRMTYRYRLRIVVKNPNLKREDVAPGVDSSSEELFGPWSEPTDEVTVPADVTTYVTRMNAYDPRSAARPEEVHFEVARWNPDDGQVVVRGFDAAPGEIVGEAHRVLVPTTDGTDAKSKPVDFNSHQVILDVLGGPHPLPPVPRQGGLGSNVDVPATALLLRPDGSVVIRNQARDARDPELKEVTENYRKGLEDSGKDKQPSGYGYGSEGYAP